MLKVVYMILLNEEYFHFINVNKLKYNFILKNCWRINSTSKNKYCMHFKI